jgi:hypothetical protein
MRYNWPNYKPQIIKKNKQISFNFIQQSGVKQKSKILIYKYQNISLKVNLSTFFWKISVRLNYVQQNLINA